MIDEDWTFPRLFCIFTSVFPIHLICYQVSQSPLLWMHRSLSCLSRLLKSILPPPPFKSAIALYKYLNISLTELWLLLVVSPPPPLFERHTVAMVIFLKGSDYLTLLPSLSFFSFLPSLLSPYLPPCLSPPLSAPCKTLKRPLALVCLIRPPGWIPCQPYLLPCLLLFYAPS